MRLSREAWASGLGKLFVVSLVAQDRSTESTEFRSAQSLGASGIRSFSIARRCLLDRRRKPLPSRLHRSSCTVVATYKSKTAETRTGAMANWGWSTGTSGYDDEDRLVSWTRDDNNLSQSWTLTNEGDWSQFVENTTTENRTHGPAHELTSITIGSTQYNLGHDVKGNLTDIPSGLRPTASRLSWDFDNRMSAADTDGDNVDDVTLKYDALGRRVAKTSGSASVVYVSMTQPIQYSPFAGQVVAEYASGAAATSPTEKYVYASYIDEPVLKDGTGGTVYYHRNSQYSVCALTSASGAVVERYGYEPYGELTILAADGTTVRALSSYANTYTYTGRRWDADLSLYYFRARYYDPKLGRFVGRDPLGYVDGLSLFANRFVIRHSDPSGTCQDTDICGPDITTEFWKALKRTCRRMREQVQDSDKGLIDGLKFLWNNGGNIDFQVDAFNRFGCASGTCENTVMLADRCVNNYQPNNIMYGFVGRFVTTNISFWDIVTGGNAHELAHTGHLESTVQRSSYYLGWRVAEAMLNNCNALSLAELKEFLQTERWGVLETVSLGELWGSIFWTDTLLDRISQDGKYDHCDRCPRASGPDDVTKDFSKMYWKMNNGGNYAPLAD